MMQQAREKAEVRAKAEETRKKAAEIQRKEEERKIHKERRYKQKRKVLYDEALETDRLIRRMKERIAK